MSRKMTFLPGLWRDGVGSEAFFRSVSWVYMQTQWQLLEYVAIERVLGD